MQTNYYAIFPLSQIFPLCFFSSSSSVLTLPFLSVHVSSRSPFSPFRFSLPVRPFSFFFPVTCPLAVIVPACKHEQKKKKARSFCLTLAEYSVPVSHLLLSRRGRKRSSTRLTSSFSAQVRWSQPRDVHPLFFLCGRTPSVCDLIFRRKQNARKSDGREGHT